MKKYLVVLILGAVLVFAGNVYAIQPAPFITICHTNPSQSVTLSFVNEESYNGHLGTPHNNETFDTVGECASATPTPTATPTETPSTPSCASDQHLDASGRNCVSFSNPGPGDSGIGGPAGQVLGTSTMAGTGAVEDALFNSMFALGSLLTSFGIMKNGKKRV